MFNHLQKKWRKLHGLQNTNHKFPLNSILGLYKVKKDYAIILPTIFSPLHNLPIGDQLFQNKFFFDKSNLGNKNNIIKHVAKPISQEIHNNFVRQV